MSLDCANQTTDGGDISSALVAAASQEVRATLDAYETSQRRHDKGQHEQLVAEEPVRTPTPPPPPLIDDSSSGHDQVCGDEKGDCGDGGAKKVQPSEELEPASLGQMSCEHGADNSITDTLEELRTHADEHCNARSPHTFVGATSVQQLIENQSELAEGENEVVNNPLISEQVNEHDDGDGEKRRNDCRNEPGQCSLGAGGGQATQSYLSNSYENQKSNHEPAQGDPGQHDHLAHSTLVQQLPEPGDGDLATFAAPLGDHFVPVVSAHLEADFQECPELGQGRDGRARRPSSLMFDEFERAQAAREDDSNGNTIDRPYLQADLSGLKLGPLEGATFAEINYLAQSEAREHSHQQQELHDDDRHHYDTQQIALPTCHAALSPSRAPHWTPVQESNFAQVAPNDHRHQVPYQCFYPAVAHSAPAWTPAAAFEPVQYQYQQQPHHHHHEAEIVETGQRNSHLMSGSCATQVRCCNERQHTNEATPEQQHYPKSRLANQECGQGYVDENNNTNQNTAHTCHRQSEAQEAAIGAYHPHYQATSTTGGAFADYFTTTASSAPTYLAPENGPGTAFRGCTKYDHGGSLIEYKPIDDDPRAIYHQPHHLGASGSQYMESTGVCAATGQTIDNQHQTTCPLQHQHQQAPVAGQRVVPASHFSQPESFELCARDQQQEQHGSPNTGAYILQDDYGKTYHLLGASEQQPSICSYSEHRYNPETIHHHHNLHQGNQIEVANSGSRAVVIQDPYANERMRLSVASTSSGDCIQDPKWMATNVNMPAASNNSVPTVSKYYDPSAEININLIESSMDDTSGDEKNSLVKGPTSGGRHYNTSSSGAKPRCAPETIERLRAFLFRRKKMREISPTSGTQQQPISSTSSTTWMSNIDNDNNCLSVKARSETAPKAQRGLVSASSSSSSCASLSRTLVDEDEQRFSLLSYDNHRHHHQQVTLPGGSPQESEVIFHQDVASTIDRNSGKQARLGTTAATLGKDCMNSPLSMNGSLEDDGRPESTSTPEEDDDDADDDMDDDDDDGRNDDNYNQNRRLVAETQRSSQGCLSMHLKARHHFSTDSSSSPSKNISPTAESRQLRSRTVALPPSHQQTSQMTTSQVDNSRQEQQRMGGRSASLSCYGIETRASVKRKRRESSPGPSSRSQVTTK